MSPTPGFEWFIARRYLASSRGRLLSFITWIALGGVVVGVTALVVVIGVMTGMQEDLRGKILESLPHITLLENGSDLRMRDWRAVQERVRGVEGVVSASPFVLSQVSLIRMGTDYAQPADLYGVALDPDGVPVTEMEAKIRDGAISLDAGESGLPGIVLGRDLAARMGLFRGDTVRVLAFEGAERRIDPFTGVPMPAIREFEVTDTFATGMWDYDIKNVYVALEAAQELVSILETDQISGLGIKTDDLDRTDEIASAIGEEVGLSYYPLSWAQQNRALFSALELEKLAMGLILFLIVIVAAFNIVGTLVMVVVDRTREIGILKSMGVTDRGILRVFLLQGTWIGLYGTAIGTIVGIVIAVLIDRYDLIKIPADVYFVESLPVSIRARDLLMIVSGSMAIAFVATIYPALRAAGLQPVEAIRHE